MKSKRKPVSDNEHLSAIQQLQDFQEADRDMRDLMREQDAFVLEKDGQWEENIAKTMDAAKRPRYTFDQTTPAIEFIAGEIEDMDFAVNVKPIGDGADRDLADLREGMIRAIENMSDASDIYRNAGRRILRRGFDAWMVKNTHYDEMSFEQDLQVVKIPNAINRVWTDPTSTEEDNSDAKCTYVLHSMSPAKYKKYFPKGKAVSIDDTDYQNHDSDYEAEVIVIACKYYQKEVKKRIVQMTNGAVYEVDDKFMMLADELAAQSITIARQKEAMTTKFCYRYMDGSGWLTEEKETPFKTNPIVTVYGNFELTGPTSKRICSGITMKMMDYNRVLNYAKSREIEEGALAPRKKLVMTKKHAEGNVKQLQSMNTSSDPVLFVNPDPEAGFAPYETAGPQVNPHLNAVSNDMAMGLLVTAGVNNAMNGDFASRMSEDALRMQIDRGIATTRKWVNALARGIRRTGQLLNEAIPVVYDTKRMFNILNIDGTEEEVILNDEMYDQQTQQMVKLNNLAQGRYQVFCNAGQAYGNRLEAARDALVELAKVDPTFVQLAGDIMAKSIDAPYMDEIAKRKRAIMLQQGMIPFDQMTEEEQQQAMQAAQQPQQPSAEMVLAQAEMIKGQADIADAETDRYEAQIKAFEAETRRQKVMVDAQKAGADIENKRVDTTGKQIDNMMKVTGVGVAR